MSRAVTVVIPAHGAPAALLELLGALDAQARGGAPLPVVVSDDASPQLLEPVLAAEPLGALELAVVRDEVNGGPGAARNRALARVRTPWVAFIDADELPAADWLERLEALVSSEDAPDVIVGRVAIPGAATPFQHATEATAEEQQYVAGNIAFRTANLRADGGFDERFYDPVRRLHFREDAELRFRLEAIGRRVDYIADLVVEHPPLRSSLWGPARLARRYYFDPLLSREHPERFHTFVRARRVGPVGLRRARHDAALLYAGGLAVAGGGVVARSRVAAAAGATAALAGWVLNLFALGYRKQVAPRHVGPLALLASVVPLVYLWHFYRGVLVFRHHPRF